MNDSNLGFIPILLRFKDRETIMHEIIHLKKTIECTASFQSYAFLTIFSAILIWVCAGAVLAP